MLDYVVVDSSSFLKTEDHDDVIKDLQAVRSVANVMHSGIDKTVQSFTSL